MPGYADAFVAGTIGWVAESVILALWYVAGGALLRVIISWEGASTAERVVLGLLWFLFAPATLLYVIIMRPFARPASFPLRLLVFSPFAALPQSAVETGSRVVRTATFSLLPGRVTDKAIVRVFWVLTAVYQLYGLLNIAAACFGAQ